MEPLRERSSRRSVARNKSDSNAAPTSVVSGLVILHGQTDDQQDGISLIARDEVFDNTERPIVLNPSLYQFLRNCTAQDDFVRAIPPALTVVADAHPVLEGGLEKSTPLKRQMAYQIQQFLKNIEDMGLSNADFLKELHDFWGHRKGQFCEALAEVLLEAIGNYGDYDELDKALINLVDVLLRDSRSIFLQSRLWSKRLPLEYYKHGKLYEGCAAADLFLNSLANQTSRQGWTNRDNAEVGILRALTVEYRLPEPGLTPAQRWQKRAEYIDTWTPLQPDDPSTLERYVVGLCVRMRGKLVKDFGQFTAAYQDLKTYCELHADRGSREEGWAIGDFGQLVLELEETDEGPAIAADLAEHGTNFGEKVLMTDGMRPCDLVGYILERAIESRMFERGYLTPEARLNAREGDTMWLELIHAMTLVHQGKHAPERLVAAEEELLCLSEQFRRIEAVESWYDEQIRHFAVKCSLAQVSHMQYKWIDAQERWEDAIRYGEEMVSDWKGKHYYIEVARYSLADAQCSAGVDPRLVIPGLAHTIKSVNDKRVQWMLGMGSFWLDFIHDRMVPRIQALERWEQTTDMESKIAVLPVTVKEL
ncbi:hypothetical protein F4821DRAFT_154062 [Hypoxylon rubiginosum]|uniref:Uncharacterized protein n=1 Tax=Hypoxylon rubiginosum TaxID=110542 RepID=A0ACC0CXX9_9PEZI|nr:hypothetical protein F4821DRAFT_154062 [Hypoxylon rubiginosum]